MRVFINVETIIEPRMLSDVDFQSAFGVAWGMIFQRLEGGGETHEVQWMHEKLSSKN